MIVQFINNAGHHLMEWEVKDILGRMKILVGLTGWVDHVSSELQLVTTIMMDRWTFAVALKKSSLQWHEREEGLWGCWILWQLPQQGTDIFLDNIFYLNLEPRNRYCFMKICVLYLLPSFNTLSRQHLILQTPDSIRASMECKCNVNKRAHVFWYL